MPGPCAQTYVGFVLAAGRGRRLRPVTLDRPKSLVPFCGVPLLDLALDRIAAAGCATVCINCGYRMDDTAEAARTATARLGLDLCLSREPQLLDTGGGIRTGVSQLATAPEHILIHNADVVLDFDSRALVETHLAQGNWATLCMIRGYGPQTVELDRDNRIVSLRRRRGTAGHTYTGVAVIRRSLLDLLPDTPVCSIVDALETAMARGLPVRVVPLPTSAYWEDLGTPEAYVTAHRRVTGYTIRHHSALAAAVAEQGRRRSALCATGVRLTGAVGLGRDAGAAPGTHLHNTVLWDGVQVPGTALWTDHVFTADPTSPPPLTPDRTPDARLLATIDAAPDQVRLTPGYVRASQRMYRRVQHSDGRSWIWCAYARERDENNSFPALARFLADQGLRVPRVLHHLADVGEMLLQDLGDRTLDALPAGPALDHHLHEVIEQVARLHTLPDRCIETAELPLQPEFTDATYDWEVDYFREFFLGTTLDAPELWETAAPDYRKVRNTLHRAVPSLVHRDLQSANVMLYEGQAYIIDFQGMRRGPAAYDLASLLYDPYRCHERALRSALLDEYGRRGGRSMTVQALACGAVQRLLQALGAYGKLWMCERRDWYREHLIAGVNMLEEAAWDHTGLPGITDLARTARTRLTARMARGLV